MRGPALAKVLGLLAASALAACEASPPAAPPSSGPPATASAPRAAAGDVTWVEHLPQGEADDAALPLVVGVHGLGDNPDSFCHVFGELRARVRVACPRAFSRHGRGWSWFPLGKPDAQQAIDIAAAADRLGDAIAALAASRRAPGLPIVTGFSQGGALALALAVRRPGSIRRAVPMGGWLPPGLHPPQGRRVAPITALHGEADSRVPFDRTRALIDTLAARGEPATMRSFPGVGHTVPPEVRGALYGAIQEALDAGGGPGDKPVP
jgi:phospholipase/carboxylesterase